MRTVELDITDVVFRSALDEEMLFAWIGRIGCVEGILGRGRTLVLSVDLRKVTQARISEGVAMCSRYGIPDGSWRSLAGRPSRKKPTR